jgi:hypothetical protein
VPRVRTSTRHFGDVAILNLEMEGRKNGDERHVYALQQASAGSGTPWPRGRGKLNSVGGDDSDSEACLARDSFHWPAATGRRPLAGGHWPAATGRRPLAGLRVTRGLRVGRTRGFNFESQRPEPGLRRSRARESPAFKLSPTRCGTRPGPVTTDYTSQPGGPLSRVPAGITGMS